MQELIAKCIERLEKLREELRRDLASKASFHAAAWAEYGSELCAGGMLADENRIRQRIAEVERDLNLLRETTAHDLEEANIKDLERAVAARMTEIAFMNIGMLQLKEKIDGLKRVRELIKSP